MRTPVYQLILATSILGSFFRCNDDPKELGVRSEHMVVAASCPSGASCRDTISVMFLGVGGFLIRHGAHAIMTAPLFTHPNLVEVIARGGSDQALVARQLQRVETSGVEAILAGHSHYDHLMDVPSLLEILTPTPVVVGSATMGHVLAGDPRIDKARVFPIDTLRAASATADGQWYDIADASGQRWFRIKAVMSTHAPNFGDVTISNYSLSADLSSLPSTPFDWPKGEVFAFIIDVLADDGAVLFRMYYQDSASDPEHSVRPKLEANDTSRFDLAIVCAGNFDKAEGYPTSVLRAFDPSFALVGHWDNFFRSVDKDATLIPGLNGNELRRLMDDAMGDRWAALRPFATAVFAVAPRQ